MISAGTPNSRSARSRSRACIDQNLAPPATRWGLTYKGRYWRQGLAVACVDMARRLSRCTRACCISARSSARAMPCLSTISSMNISICGFSVAGTSAAAAIAHHTAATHTAVVAERVALDRLIDHRVAQHTDPFDFRLEHVARDQ